MRVGPLLVALCVCNAILAAGRATGCANRGRSTRECLPLLQLDVPVPKTAAVPHVLKAPAGVRAPPRSDPYHWLRDDARNNSAVLSHLQEENAYAEAVLRPSLPLQQRLREEMQARVPRDESSLPQRVGRHWYYSRHSIGKQYRRFCRRRIDDPAALPTEHDVMNLAQPEEVLLDVNELAGEHSLFDMVGPILSPDEQLLAFGTDTAGGEVYTVRVHNLTSATVLLDGGSEDTYADQFRQAAGDFVFLSDSRTLLFTTLTRDTHRPDKVWLLELDGKPTKADQVASQRVARHMPRLLHHEPDEAFHLTLWRSRSDAVIYLRGASETTHYLHYMAASAPAATANFSVLAPLVGQEQQYVVRDTPSSSSSCALLFAVLYTPDALNGQLVVTQLKPNALANASALLQRTSSSGTEHGSGRGGTSEQAGTACGGGQRRHHTLLQPHDSMVEIVDLTVSSTHLTLLERKNGTLAATAYPLPDDGTPPALLRNGKQFDFSAPSYSLEFGDQGPFASSVLRIRYSSLAQPSTTYDINMATGNRVLKKQQEVLGFDGTMHALHARLLWANSTGVQVPISLVYRAEMVRLDGTAPLLLEVYGAYGAPFAPEFSASQLSLLDRGFIRAIAHVRGGGDMGRYWYYDGKLLSKNHTFDDTAAAARFLIQARYTSSDRMALWGRSAGGLTVGATINRHPELFKAAIADVPFVDVLTTLSDPSLPLTVIEFEEWGRPQDQAAYDNILSFSPVDNVARQPYPHLLLTAGLNDPRVSFWEPAKLAAQVREMKTSSDSLVMLKTNMRAGHFGSSGLEARLEETAFKYAFLLQTLAPCAIAGESSDPGAGCHGCFAALVASAATLAMVTLVLALRPASHKWHRAGGCESTSGEQDSDEETGFDTRLYTAHMSGSRAAEAAADVARQLKARQQQLEAQGVSLTSYDSVHDTIRERLLPIPSPSSAALAAASPPRRLSHGAAAAGGGSDDSGGIELSQLHVRSGAVAPRVSLPAIAETPTSAQGDA